MAEAKKEFFTVKATTPRVVFKFPKLNAPDYGTEKFPDENGSFSVKCVADLHDPAIKAFFAKLKPAYDRAVAEGKEQFAALKPEARKRLKEPTLNPLYTELLDPETEEPTGQIEFKVSMKAKRELKKGPNAGKIIRPRPQAFDAKGNKIELFRKDGDPIPTAPQVWSGTVGRVSVETAPYFVASSGTIGLSLKLVGFQIIELRTAGERSAKDLGFEAEEDGYEADNSFKDETDEENVDETNVAAKEGGAAGDDDDF